jgi:hypothetical protein
VQVQKIYCQINWQSEKIIYFGKILFMKKILTVFCLCALLSHTQAQKCTFTKEETDSKSGLPVKSIMTSVTNQFIVWTIKEADQYKLGLEITMSGLHKENIRKGDTLTITFGNYETILAFATEQFSPVGKANDLTEITNYFPFYNVSNDDWMKLCANNIQFMKVVFKGDYVNIELNEGKAKKIKTAAVCVK